jgi:hypothetical protein
MVREVGIHNLSHEPRFNDPDYRAENYGRLRTEFGAEADIRFEKHIARLEMLRKFFQNENGTRMNSILRREPTWYPARDQF